MLNKAVDLISLFFRTFLYVLLASMQAGFFGGLIYGTVLAVTAPHIMGDGPFDYIITPIGMAAVGYIVSPLFAFPIIVIFSVLSIMLMRSGRWRRQTLTLLGFAFGGIYGVITPAITYIYAITGAITGFILFKSGKKLQSIILHDITLSNPATPQNTTNPQINSATAQYFRAVITTIGASPFGGFVGCAIYLIARATIEPSLDDQWYHYAGFLLIAGPLAGLFYAFPAAFIVAIPLTFLIRRDKWNPLFVIVCLLLCGSIWLLITSISAYLLIPGAITTGIIVYLFGKYIRSDEKYKRKPNRERTASSDIS